LNLTRIPRRVGTAGKDHSQGITFFSAKRFTVQEELGYGITQT